MGNVGGNYQAAVREECQRLPSGKKNYKGVRRMQTNDRPRTDSTVTDCGLEPHVMLRSLKQSKARSGKRTGRPSWKTPPRP